MTYSHSMLLYEFLLGIKTI